MSSCSFAGLCGPNQWRDRQAGFPHEAGCLDPWLSLPAPKGHSCYRPRRTGERKRKSVRGCIVDANLSVLNLVIVKKGEPFILEFIFVNTDLKLIVFESGLSGFGNA